MSVETGFYGIAALLILLILRVPVALAMITVSFGGIVSLLGTAPAIGILQNTPYDFAAKWTMSAVPMFLLMGFVAFHANLTSGLFTAAKVLLKRIPGALAIASVFTCSGFAAVCGSSIATAASMGRIAIPEMVKAGYSPSIAAGAIAAGGTIGALIPPSIIMIIYGVFAETSITQVFMGGVTIGIMTAVAYSLVILIGAWIRPDLVPPRPIEGETPPLGKALIDTWPVLALIVLVFGGMFSGLFSATEAGAVGAAGALICALLVGRLNWKVLRTSLLETLQTTASLLIIGIGAAMFTRFLGITGLSNFIAAQVSGADLSYYHLMLIVVVIYFLLGMVMEPFGAMLVTLPIFIPILNAEGISLVWFGVLVVKLLEIGMVTPPVGLNVFVIRNVASEHVTTMQVFKGVGPFLLSDLVVTAIIVIFPSLVLFLPSLV
ncbi:TRAP transporter large permease [Pseudooceanicola marinus]|uniref:TRAP transporter large permease n=1 Tax=Pseudooceanicola marinus TaxID=396013 RepID=UPI001C946CC7|nr:TRAP transporter large permease subunit [Pseudooceanicola marinus]MBY5973027.1 TRAP transporter large permease subunit [Ferrimonas balearica]MCA1338140.1 TRAP transporter large permease subunit [Pseudooceanicola marinus]